jgi:hypothetical protein
MRKLIGKPRRQRFRRFRSNGSGAFPALLEIDP